MPSRKSKPETRSFPRARALLLAAGVGSRLRPLTDRVPKCLVPIAGRPLMDYWLHALADAGVREGRVNTHALPERVRSYVAAVNARGGMRLDESHEPELLGSAGTIAANADLAYGADHVMVIYADNFSRVSLRRMLAYHRSHEDPVTMLLFRAPNPRACGIAELDGEGRVVSFVEKPERPASDLANAGVYIFDAAAYREAAAMGAFDIGFDVLPRFVGRMRGWEADGFYLDIGTPEAYERACEAAGGVLADGGYDERGRRPAVFFDRDGTLIEDAHYLSDPADVAPIEGAAEAVRRLRAAGFACVIVSNQSAVARGIITEADLEEIHERMCRLFAERGAVFDGIYHCPIGPGTADRTVVEHEDRKPGPGMLRRAASELGLDLERSWMVGDMISDVLAGQNAGCRGSVLVETGKGASETERAAAEPFATAPDVPAAAELIIGDTTGGCIDVGRRRNENAQAAGR